MVMGAHEAYAFLTSQEQAERKKYGNPKPLVRFMTKEMQTWGPVGDYRELEFSHEETTPGGMSFLVPDDKHYSEYFYGQSRNATRPVVVDLPGWRTLWFITGFNRVRAGLKRYIEVEAVHCMEYLNWVRIYPDPGLPPEFQPSKWRSPIGPAASVCAWITNENLRRVQGGKAWPVMVHPRLFNEPDPSTWTSGNYRMDKLLDALLEICETEDLQIVLDLFLPGEDEQPFSKYFNLTEPTLVVDFVPRMPLGSMAGTIQNGLFRTGVEILNDLVEWVTVPVMDPQDPIAIDKLTGRDGEVFPVYGAGEWSAVDKVSQKVHIPLASRVTAGGKSPDYINDVAVGAVTGAVSFIGSFFGLGGLKLGFLEERVKNVAMAFHTTENQHAVKESGPWRLREAFAESQSSGLSLQIWQSMKSTMFAHRGYTSHLVEVSNGSPYWVGKHIKVGWPVGITMPDGTVEVDRCTAILFSDTRDDQGKIVLQIGSGAADVEPGLRGLARIRRMGSWLHRVAVGG